MTLIRRLRSVFGRDTASQSYTYRCLACDEQFVSDESHMARVSCPACGSNDVQSVAGEA
jgi:Zn finger protein HypA/HybF involved in hydrogenase expression